MIFLLENQTFFVLSYKSIGVWQEKLPFLIPDFKLQMGLFAKILSTVAHPSDCKDLYIR